MPRRLKTADTPNGFMITFFAKPFEPSWLAGGIRLKNAYMKELGRRALIIKHKEILRGIDKDGKRFKRLSKATVRNRRSHVGQADPYAPVFIPAYEQSRTYAFLRYELRSEGIWFFWKYDPKTGSSWGDILRLHASGEAAGGKIRDSFGISPQGMRILEREMEAWFEQNKYKYIPKRYVSSVQSVSSADNRFNRAFNRNIRAGIPPVPVLETRKKGIVRQAIEANEIASGSGPLSSVRGFRQKRIIRK